MENFQINSMQIDKNKEMSMEEKNFRIKNLEFFQANGFPNKRLEDWKFSDFKNIVDKNFKELNVKKVSFDIKKFDLIKDFEHNYILLVNGHFHSSNFNFEDKSKIKINSYDKSIDYNISKNSLICLNHAFAENGYSLEVEKNYKFKKALVIYNLFKKDVKEKEDFNSVLKLIKKYNALETTFKRAEYFVNVSCDSLGIFENCEEKRILQNLTGFSLNRSY